MAIVRVATSRHILSIARLKNVNIEVADSRFDSATIAKLIKGCRKVFFVTKYWENLKDELEKAQVFTICKACAKAKVKKIVFSTYEDVGKLQTKGLKSQIIGYNKEKKPLFEGMKEVKDYANSLKIETVHMITSFLDKETSKKSICMIASSNGDFMVASEH